ncbi:MAG: aminotransferase class III-fold pyridoxal phosphate-dependent enzyme, partial [Eudoraea sp.]|uniref:aminotransferase class III-fold pyridoxal phosphate-dependent enzyme n=1 Tax=Eudoraea sp. TaxID=1979955 RepID=UPI003C770B23
SLEKEKLIRAKLKHPKIIEVRGKGLMLAIILKNETQVNDLIHYCARKKLILFWLLFEKKAVRITPPLTISKEEINEGCDLILEALEAT